MLGDSSEKGFRASHDGADIAALAARVRDSFTSVAGQPRPPNDSGFAKSSVMPGWALTSLTTMGSKSTLSPGDGEGELTLLHITGMLEDMGTLDENVYSASKFGATDVNGKLILGPSSVLDIALKSHVKSIFSAPNFLPFFPGMPRGYSTADTERDLVQYSKQREWTYEY